MDAQVTLLRIIGYIVHPSDRRFTKNFQLLNVIKVTY